MKRLLVAARTVQEATDWGKAQGLSPTAYSPLTETSIRGAHEPLVVWLDGFTENARYGYLYPELQIARATTISPEKWQAVIDWARQFDNPRAALNAAAEQRQALEGARS